MDSYIVTIKGVQIRLHTVVLFKTLSLTNVRNLFQFSSLDISAMETVSIYLHNRSSPKKNTNEREKECKMNFSTLTTEKIREK